MSLRHFEHGGVHGLARKAGSMALSAVLATAFMVPVGAIDAPEAEASVDSGIFAGGTGAEEDPYQISNESQLKAFRDYVNKTSHGMKASEYAGSYFKLTSDIELTGDWTPIGTSTSNAFDGNFDGDGHTISGLAVDVSSSEDKADSNVGFFGYVKGYSNDVTIRDVKVTGSITGRTDRSACVGGLIGNASVSTGYPKKTYLSISNCVANVDVKGVQQVGGLIGTCPQNTTVTNCLVQGDVTGVDAGLSNSAYVGGVIGQGSSMSTTSTLNNCLYTGQVTSSPGSAGSSVGGGMYKTAGAIIGKMPSSNSERAVNCYHVAQKDPNVGSYHSGKNVQADPVIEESWIVSLDTEVETQSVVEKLNLKGQSDEQDAWAADGKTPTPKRFVTEKAKVQISKPIASDGVCEWDAASQSLVANVGVKGSAGYTLANTSAETAQATIDEAGDAVAQHAGSYQVTATLDSGYVWSDGTSGPVQLSFTVAKGTYNPIESFTFADGDQQLSFGETRDIASLNAHASMLCFTQTAGADIVDVSVDSATQTMRIVAKAAGTTTVTLSYKPKNEEITAADFENVPNTLSFRVTVSELDLEGISAALADADAASADTVISDDPALVPTDKRCVGKDDAQKLADAVTAAKAARDEGASQSSVDAAKQNLEEALIAYHAAAKAGTKDVAAAAEALDEASKTLAGVKVSKNGSDVSPDEKWATSEAIVSFQKALDEARAIIDDENSNADQVAQARAAVRAAEQAFASTVKAGTKGTGVKAGQRYSLGSGSARASYQVVKPASAKSQGTVLYRKSLAPKKAKTIKVPSTVRIGGKAYRVVGVAAGAFRGCKKLRSLAVGRNVRSIGKSAFSGCKKLGTVTVRSKYLKTKKSVRGCLKGSSVKTVRVKGVSGKAKKRVERAFSRKSWTGKKVRVK